MRVKADCDGRFGADTAENPKRNLTPRRRGRGVNAEKRRKEFNTESTGDTPIGSGRAPGTERRLERKNRERVGTWAETDLRPVRQSG